MAKAKRGSKNWELSYAKYKNSGKELANRKAKLEKFIAKNPENEQAKIALKDIHHRRHVPKAAFWSHQMIATAKLMKEFTGKFNKDMFNADPIKRHAATMTRDANKFVSQIKKGESNTQEKSTGSMFSLGTQMFSKGHALWN
jgi:hypothetical protein